MNLHRALVAALHAPGLLARPDVFARFALSDVERAWLLAVDPRALGTDPARRERLIRTLAEELPASVTLYTRHVRSLAALHAFCESEPFLDALATDGPLVLAFARFLADALPPAARDVVAIERLKAEARRSAQRPPTPGGVSVAPGVRAIAVGEHALPLLQAIEAWHHAIAKLPQALLCDDAPEPPAIPDAPGARTWLLSEARANDVGLVDTDADLVRVLEYFAIVRPRGSLAIPGVPPARAGALVDALIADGLLIEA